MNPAFRCDGDALGHATVGFHDGIDSWTVALESGQTPRVQAFVGLHERAHHRLHSLTPWGLAMVLCGLPGPDRTPAEVAWLDLVKRCRVVHERYATWTAVTGLRDGLEYLRGNLAYLAHYAGSRRLSGLVGDPLTPEVAVEMLSLAAMAPVGLIRLDLTRVRSGDARSVVGPDQRLEYLIERVASDGGVARAVREALHGHPRAGLAGENSDATDDSDGYWDGLCSLLAEIDVETATAAEQREWSKAMVAQFDELLDRAGLRGRGRVVLQDASVPTTDQLTALVDTHQRERLRLHAEPLQLQVAELATSSLSLFTRQGEDGQPFVVLAWLHEGFLKRQFSTVVSSVPVRPGAETGKGLTSCLMTVDRRAEPGHGLLLPIPDSPAAASAVLTAASRKDRPYRATAAASISTIRFSTLRALAETGDDVDFRGWDPAFVLVDSDALVFLNRTASDPAGAVWTVIDVAADRHVDVLLVRRRSSPSEVFLLPCSAPTGRIIGAWVNERDAFIQDAAAFDDVRRQAFDLLQILLGTLWVLDRHGWQH